MEITIKIQFTINSTLMQQGQESNRSKIDELTCSSFYSE